MSQKKIIAHSKNKGLLGQTCGNLPIIFFTKKKKLLLELRIM